MKIVIDSSAWINVTDNARVSELSARLLALSGTVEVPKEVLGEFLAQPDPERAWTNIQTMNAVDRAGSVVQTEGFGGIFAAECRRTRLLRRRPSESKLSSLQPLSVAPRIGRGEALPLIACFQNRELFRTQYTELQRNASWLVDRTELHLLDKAARQKADTITVHVAHREFREMIAAKYPAGLIESPGFTWLVKDRRRRSYALGKPHLFRTTLLWALCQDLSMWGIVQASKCPGAVPWFESVKKNTSRDNKIAGCAAYSDYFVTDDVKLAPRVSFAAQTLGFRLRAQSLDDFLRGGVPPTVTL